MSVPRIGLVRAHLGVVGLAVVPLSCGFTYWDPDRAGSDQSGGSVLCDDRWVDVGNDPDNCGKCGHRCQLPNASSACVKGECAVLSCTDGFSDIDGDPATGCEAGKCRTVQPVEVPEEAPELRCDGDCSAVSCVPDGQGGVRFEYAVCSSDSLTWASCVLASSLDMTEFDRSYGGSRLLEVRFCVEERAGGALDLWYGEHPLRKWLPLIEQGTTLEPGCYVRYFDGSDARFPTWCDIPAACKQDCPDPQCLEEYRARTEQWSESDIALDEECHRSDPNLQGLSDAELEQELQELRDEYEGAASRFSLRRTPLNLTVEWCDSRPRQGSVHVEAVRFLSSTCQCSQDQPCASDVETDASTCHPLPDNCVREKLGACGPSILGCAGPPGPGVACTFTAERATYPGVTKCVDGAYVCAPE